MVQYVQGVPASIDVVEWCGLQIDGKFNDWRKRYGNCTTEDHSAIENWERQSTTSRPVSTDVHDAGHVVASEPIDAVPCVVRGHHSASNLGTGSRLKKGTGFVCDRTNTGIRISRT